MKPNDEGSLAPCAGYLAERMHAMSEFSRSEMPAVNFYEFVPLLDSSDMGPEDWIRIALLIEQVYHTYDAFIIIMGTDTMAYAASALSFIFENLSKMVVITGSMLPLSDLFNDAQRNLIVSIVMATILDIPEVTIFMDDKLLRGNRTVKSNSSGLDAFESPNYPALAHLETGLRFRVNSTLSPPKGRFRVHTTLDTNVAVWRMIPGFDDEYILNSIKYSSKLRAIVLELYGTGNLSSRKQSLVEALGLAIQKGIIIVAVSQCLRGTVDLRAYALGRKLEAIGVLSGYDMTTEAVCTKLAYLLSWPNITADQVKQYMSRSLRGELTESISISVIDRFVRTRAENGEVFITMKTISKATNSMNMNNNTTNNNGGNITNSTNNMMNSNNYATTNAVGISSSGTSSTVTATVPVIKSPSMLPMNSSNGPYLATNSGSQIQSGGFFQSPSSSSIRSVPFNSSSVPTVSVSPSSSSSYQNSSPMIPINSSNHVGFAQGVTQELFIPPPNINNYSSNKDNDNRTNVPKLLKEDE